MNQTMTTGQLLKAFLILAFLFGNLGLMQPEMVRAAEVQATVNAGVNVNTASLEDLQMIRGVGPTLAERIIQYRSEVGLFESKDDLANVRGIGGSRLQSIKEQVTV